MRQHVVDPTELMRCRVERLIAQCGDLTAERRVPSRESLVAPCLLAQTCTQALYESIVPSASFRR